MPHVMRQSRDGIIEIIDSRPQEAQGLAGFFRTRFTWTKALRWFMRTLAWVWVVKGLFNWAVILGVSNRFGDFVMLPHALQATVVFFAAGDLFAAIGLWLTAPWGSVLWLLCAVVESASPFAGARGAFVNAVGVGLNLTLVLVYFLLSWWAGQERD